MDTTPESLLEFWFPAFPYSADNLGDAGKLWFFPSPDQNRQITARFTNAVGKALRGELDHWERSARGKLALILLLDQFTRCVYRGTPQAFSGDGKALELALTGIDPAEHCELDLLHRFFFFMPCQHSEDLGVQDRSVALFIGLARQGEGPEKKVLQNGAEYAQLHRDIVARFGRFPHRNKILGRPNTPEEDDYLADDAPTFGQ